MIRRKTPFDHRGMGMDDVQAGKTGKCTALVSKATDVGYKAIIIAGDHENLRSQSRTRITKA